jgi:ribosomal protein L7/L12
MGFFGSDASIDPQLEVDVASLKERVAWLEATVAQLLAAAPSSVSSAAAPAVTPPAEPAYVAEVRALKAQGKLIHAIKVYREATGTSLKAAKDHVERMV